MYEITGKCSLHSIRRIKALKPAVPYLIHGGGAFRVISRLKIETMRKLGWNIESMVYGLNRLRAVAEAGSYLYPVYSPNESKADKAKKDVNVIHFPPLTDTGAKPFVVVCAGGAYMSVCSAVEAYPVASRLNELGYTAFVLTYRVGGKGLMPGPVDDLAASIRFIRANSEAFRVDPDQYIVAGFSAGAHLTALWGTDNHGYVAYGLPKPTALFPIYPAITSRLYNKDKLSTSFQQTMFGKTYTPEQAAEYNIDEHAGAGYPPSYIVCCADDPVVPCENSKCLKSKLDELVIPAALEVGDKGGHGFGEGLGTGVEGWIHRAAAFSETLEGMKR